MTNMRKRTRVGPATRLALTVGAPALVRAIGMKNVREHPILTGIGLLGLIAAGLYVDREIVPETPWLASGLTLAEVVTR